MGIALRACSEECRDFYLRFLSGPDKEEVIAILNGPPMQKVNVDASTAKVVKLVQAKCRSGEYNLDPNDELV